MRRFVDSIMFLLVAYTVGLPFVRGVFGPEPGSFGPAVSVGMPIGPEASVSEDDVTDGDGIAHEITTLRVSGFDVPIGVLAHPIANTDTDGEATSTPAASDATGSDAANESPPRPDSRPLMRLLPAPARR